MPWIEFIKQYSFENRFFVIKLSNKYSNKGIYIFQNRNDVDVRLVRATIHVA